EEHVRLAEAYLPEYAKLDVGPANAPIRVVLQALPARIRQFDSDTPLRLALQDGRKLRRVVRCQRHRSPAWPLWIELGRVQKCVRPDHVQGAVAVVNDQLRPIRPRLLSCFHDLETAGLGYRFPRLKRMSNTGSKQRSVHLEVAAGPAQI